ncbi:MAG: multiheme c-type cytochrome, partial [Kofleriaceae bacterium]
SIATGLSGTTMPGYAGTLSDVDLWALADHVVALAGRAGRRMISPIAIAADRAAPIEVASWPGRGDDRARAVFGAAIPPQGPPPAALAPAQASLHARQCGRCHAKQVREWEPSLHRGAASPGLRAQTDYLPAAERASCLRCHAPLAEQAGDPDLQSDGVSCAGCHVRNWVRHGPPNVAPSLLPLPGYPLVTVGLYERADFCLPCHQLPPRDAVAGRPLLDTYREWLEGPYLARGVQCQHCHMPNREHTVLGIHDPATFRQGIALAATAHRHGPAVTAVARVTNIGAGHYLPTTPTPAAWLSITLIDAHGQPIAGATDRHRIGRDIWFDGTWHERADTRIPPGETLTVARAWTAGRTAEATAARIAIEVHPDDYYERFYADALAGKLIPAQRALYQQALARALGNRYLAEQRDVAIAP